ncbi:serine hydrolase [Streptomyces scopuliridis]|uniref:serine hydrolase n=1 Tax=Streptomyces scopuliridis TaxID=452529 RepID=UPI00368C9FE3
MHFTGRHRGSGAAALISAAALPLLFPHAAHAGPGASGQEQAVVVCTSPTHQPLATRLARELVQDQEGDLETLSLAVWDQRTGLVCTQRPDRHYDSASVVKVTVMGAVLRRAQEEGRPLTPEETEDLRLMITVSDNDATTRQWNSLGRERLQRFLNLAGMTDTVLGTSWGLTQVTAADEMRQLNVFTVDPDVLTPANKQYGRTLMSQVVPSQRWGAPYGAPSDVHVEVKNGWLQRATHGWRVHSLGIFSSPDDLYQMTFLSQDDPTMSYGINVIQKLAWRIHRTLNTAPGHENGTTLPFEDGYQGSEVSDGSEVDGNRPPGGAAPARP